MLTTPLKAGVTYSYRIRTSGGISGLPWPRSPPMKMKIADADASAKTASTAPTAAPVWTPDVVLDANIEDDAITLEWTALMDDVVTTGGEDITGYELNVWDGAKWVLKYNAAVDETSYQDENLAPNTTYYYALRARNSIGAGPWSEVRGVTTDPGTPDTPVLTATAASGSSIDLSWTVPDDNGATIVGYQLQRWAGGTWPAVEGSRGMVDNTDTVTEYTDGELLLEPGTKYYYRIRALTGSDAGSAWSAANTSTRGAKPLPPRMGMFRDNLWRPTSEVRKNSTATSVTIGQWVLTDDDTGGSAITGYKVQIWDGDNSRWIPEADVAGGTTTLLQG